MFQSKNYNILLSSPTNRHLHRSLGVLLYTLVYGAMPFDGSNFKRLVKQITTGDYYEPKHPSREIIYKSCKILTKYFDTLHNCSRLAAHQGNVDS